MRGEESITSRALRGASHLLGIKHDRRHLWVISLLLPIEERRGLEKSRGERTEEKGERRREGRVTRACRW